MSDLFAETMSLAELAEISNKLITQLAESGGELSPETEAALANIDIAVAKKVDSYKFVLNRLEAEEEFWKKEAEARLSIAKACANVNAKLKKSILDAMVKAEKKEIAGDTFRAVLVVTPGRLVIEDDKLTDEYKMQEVRVIANKAKIKEALNNFTKVEGAKIEGGLSLRFYAGKKD